MRISELQTKDVVSVTDGKKLGPISDIELNVQTGKIAALIIQSSASWKGWFSKGGELLIPWKDIVKIGNDVILVRSKLEEHQWEDHNS
ncbi:YlmC/YmxH family sporulation protein [Jeotgalibacillus sp. R-1-5s-1]|uniref:YlmC/YmxH family sporulation protein n=1 Tax=Jeotgalibacillus sp. R-1-5s-1 TaxID=2555897 RepID=UPI00106CB101|nr:YlmC/YmxH family sporulation protein [Jeotgalibacillus sp. R-1-5s-1]TFE03567.1 YlmC/YmxH family sporulation protein [Jeotgalibacillus sp. R-1-5s-1]